MSWGWRPSPGSVYPLLEEMQKEGLIRRRSDGRFEQTERGHESTFGPWELFGSRPTTLEGVLAEMTSFVSYLEDIKTTDSGRLQPHRGALGEIGRRLSKVAEG